MSVFSTLKFFVCFFKDLCHKREIKGQNNVSMSMFLVIFLDGTRTLWVLSVHFTTMSPL